MTEPASDGVSLELTRRHLVALARATERAVEVTQVYDRDRHLELGRAVLSDVVLCARELIDFLAPLPLAGATTALHGPGSAIQTAASATPGLLTYARNDERQSAPVEQDPTDVAALNAAMEEFLLGLGVITAEAAGRDPGRPRRQPSVRRLLDADLQLLRDRIQRLSQDVDDRVQLADLVRRFVQVAQVQGHVGERAGGLGLQPADQGGGVAGLGEVEHENSSAVQSPGGATPDVSARTVEAHADGSAAPLRGESSAAGPGGPAPSESPPGFRAPTGVR